MHENDQKVVENINKFRFIVITFIKIIISYYIVFFCNTRSLLHYQGLLYL